MARWFRLFVDRMELWNVCRTIGLLGTQISVIYDEVHDGSDSAYVSYSSLVSLADPIII